MSKRTVVTTGDANAQQPELPPELDAAYRKLQAVLRAHAPMAVAYSGGVDSGLLAYAARRTLRDDMLCVLAVSPALGESEEREAVAFLERHGIPFERVFTKELEDERYRQNHPDRCYYCKSELFALMREAPVLSRFPFVAHGANLDDSSDHRPGAQAAAEREVLAPLVEAGYTKRLIRDTAHALGLELWDKPAAPCLASRIPYFTEVTREKLRQVEKAEAALKREGFRECRVRHHGHTARIEVPLEEQPRLRSAGVWGRIEAEVKAAGFERLEIEPDGFRSGRLNEEWKRPRRA